MPPWWNELVWVDWLLLAVLVVSVVVGLVRGFVYECLSLIGWVVAWFAAQWAAPELARYLPVGTRGAALNLAVAFGLCFLAALIIWSLLARLVRYLVHATPLSIPDRVLGAGFGALRGAVLLLAVATIIALTPVAQSPGWRSAQGARWLDLALQAVKPLLPQGAARLLPA